MSWRPAGGIVSPTSLSVITFNVSIHLKCMILILKLTRVVNKFMAHVLRANNNKTLFLELGLEIDINLKLSSDKFQIYAVM